MSFASKVGSLFRQAITRHTGSNGATSMPAIYNVVRYMSSSRLFVGGISYQMDDQSLREAFTEFGDVTEARIIHDRETGRSRGFGFVSFTSNEEATAAISAMDGKQVSGRMIHVNYATERTGGFRPSGGYGQTDGYGSGGSYSQSGGGYSQNDGYGSGGSYSQNDGLGSGGGERYDGGSGDFGGGSEGSSAGASRHDFGDDDDSRDDVGNMSKGY
eukprot:Gb_18168 [translate_table: standard]